MDRGDNAPKNRLLGRRWADLRCQKSSTEETDPIRAVQGLVLSCVLVVSIIPLVRWAGALIGGRYAWWLEYHLLLSESSTR